MLVRGHLKWTKGMINKKSDKYVHNYEYHVLAIGKSEI